MTRALTSCDWVASRVSELSLNEYVDMGVLPAKDVIHWQVPGVETSPQPKEGEVIVFSDHLLCGFSPPGSKFFRDVLHFYNLHPQVIGPNSVSNVCNLQFFCEVYLQMEPEVDLFQDYFYLNRETEMTDGPSHKLGGISIQRWRDVIFPAATLPSHPKDWNNTWFYCQDTSPAGENSLPGFRPFWLRPSHELPDRITTMERAKYSSMFLKIGALIANGLSRVDLVHCWVSWMILPLSRCDGLMCEYTGDKNDPQRYNQASLTEKEITDTVKTLLGEPLENCRKVGLNTLCTLNPVPAVSTLNGPSLYISVSCASYSLTYYFMCTCIQADSSFWKKKWHVAVPIKKAKGSLAPRLIARNQQRKNCSHLMKSQR